MVAQNTATNAIAAIIPREMPLRKLEVGIPVNALHEQCLSAYSILMTFQARTTA